MMEGWRKYTKKEIDEMKEAFAAGKHIFHKIHDMPGFLRNMILKKIAEFVRTEGQLHNSKEKIDAFVDYYYETLKMPGMMDLG